MRSHGGRCMALGAVVALGMVAEEARAQGIIIDVRRPGPVAGSFEIREVRIDARVRDQVAEVQVSQTFHNPGSFPIESEYLFPLPDEGAIQNFVLMVDGQEMPGQLMPKDEARRIYEEIVRTKRDPALLEYMGRGLFKTSVFPIPPHADRKVTMRYTQICKPRPRRRRVRLPARHPEVHLQADPEARSRRSGSRAATRSSRSTARPTTPGSSAATTTRPGSASSAATWSRRPTSAWSTPSPRARSARPS